jgi:hypothetical protein
MRCGGRRHTVKDGRRALPLVVFVLTDVDTSARLDACN